MNMYWNITTSLRHLKYPRNGLRMRLVAMAYLWPIVFQKTRLNRVDFLLTIPPFCVCVHACICVCLSGHRPVASQMGVCEEDYYCKPALPTYTVSKTYIHKTHFPHYPTPTLSVKKTLLWKALNFNFKYGKKYIFSDTDLMECVCMLPLCPFSIWVGWLAFFYLRSPPDMC